MNTVELERALKTIAPAIKNREKNDEAVLEIDSNDLVITGTGRTLELINRVSSSVAPSEFSVLVSHAALLGAIKASGDENVSLERDGDKLCMSSGKRKIDIQVREPAIYEFFQPVPEQVVTLDRLALLRALSISVRCVRQGAGDSDALGCVEIKVSKDVSVTATDRHRLVSYQLEADCDKEISFLVPAVAANSLVDILSRTLVKSVALSTIEIHEGVFRLVVELPDVTWASNLVREGFPGWSEIVKPDSTDTPCIELNRDETMASLQAIQSFSRHGSMNKIHHRNPPLVDLILDDDNVLKLRYDEPGRGRILDTLELSRHEMEEFQFSAQPVFFFDLFGTVDKESVRMTSAGIRSPLKYVSGELKYIMMPAIKGRT